MNKREFQKVLFLILILVFFSSCNGKTTEEYEKVLEKKNTQYQTTVDSLTLTIKDLRDSNIIKQKILNKLKRDVDQITKAQKSGEEYIHPAKIIDYSISKKIPKAVLLLLNKKYPNFYIPKANRCKVRGRGDFILIENPFFTWGDFNSDKITDYGFLIESYGLDVFGHWGQEQRIIIMSSKDLTSSNSQIEFDFYEFQSSSSLGRDLSIHDAIVKLTPNIKYNYREREYLFDSERILFTIIGDEVGVLLEWNGKDYDRNYIWNTL